MSTIVLGGGCFWCLEAAYQLVNGVTNVTSGYAGGYSDNPNYQAVCSGQTGHAEVVKVEFDDSIVTLEDILNVFWVIHNPTTLNRQGNDEGSQYRSIILFGDSEQKAAAEASMKTIAKDWPDPVVTELQPLEKFYQAEEEHQNYFMNHPEQSYCQIVINPKLTKLRNTLADKLR